MQGKNQMTLNEATVKEALQEYFDKRTVEMARFEITEVKGGLSVGKDNTFRVTTSDREPPPVDFAKGLSTRNDESPNQNTIKE